MDELLENGTWEPSGVFACRNGCRHPDNRIDTREQEVGE